MHLLQTNITARFHFPGLHRKGPGMAARQEARLKRQRQPTKRTANRDTFAETTRRIMPAGGAKVQTNFLTTCDKM
jgi:hypothetical protein